MRTGFCFDFDGTITDRELLPYLAESIDRFVADVQKLGPLRWSDVWQDEFTNGISSNWAFEMLPEFESSI